jgi:hypothetical protein
MRTSTVEEDFDRVHRARVRALEAMRLYGVDVWIYEPLEEVDEEFINDHYQKA